MKYRKATMDDADMLMAWRNDKLTVENNRNNRPVSLAEHENWLRARLADDDRMVFIVEDDDIPVGTVRLDRIKSHESEAFETGVTVAPEARGKSYGGKCLKLVCDDYPTATLYTEIKFDNKASMKSFGAAGFNEIGSYGLWTQWRRLPIR